MDWRWAYNLHLNTIKKFRPCIFIFVINAKHGRKYRVHWEICSEPTKFNLNVGFQPFVEAVQETFHFIVDNRKVTFHRSWIEQWVDKFPMELVLIALKNEQAVLEEKFVQKSDFIKAFFGSENRLQVIRISKYQN